MDLRSLKLDNQIKDSKILKLEQELSNILRGIEKEKDLVRQ